MELGQDLCDEFIMHLVFTYNILITTTLWWFTYNILQLIAPGTWFFPLPGFTAHMQPTQSLPNSPWLIGISRQRCRLLRLVDSGFYIAYIYIYLFVCFYLFIYFYIYSIDIEIYLHPVYDHDISTHIWGKLAWENPSRLFTGRSSSHITDYQGITILMGF